LTFLTRILYIKPTLKTLLLASSKYCREHNFLNKESIQMSDDNNIPPTDGPPARYILDPQTVEELAAVFTWAQMAVDTQLDDDTQEFMQETLEVLTERLGIAVSNTEMTVKTIIEEDGSTSYNVKLEPNLLNPKPALVWTNDDPKKGLKIVDKDYKDPEDPDDDPPRCA